MINLYGIEDGDKLKSKSKGGKYYQIKTVAERRIKSINRYCQADDKAKLVTFYLLTEAEYNELLAKANSNGTE